MVIKRGTKLKASPRMPVTLTRMRSGINSRIFISNWSALMRASFMSLPLTRSAMLLSQSQWIARSPAAPDSQAVFDRFRDKVLSLLHGFAHCFAQRQMCRDCSRKDASCPVRVAPGKAFGSEAIEFFPVEKDIRGVSVQVPAFDQDVPSSGCVYGQGCLFHVVGCPARTCASSVFGVITSASGNRSLRKAAFASGSSNGAPDLDNMTGSTTSFVSPYSLTLAATTSTTAAVFSLPVLTASGGTSLNTASSWRATKSGGTSRMPKTPEVF